MSTFCKADLLYPVSDLLGTTSALAVHVHIQNISLWSIALGLALLLLIHRIRRASHHIYEDMTALYQDNFSDAGNELTFPMITLALSWYLNPPGTMWSYVILREKGGEIKEKVSFPYGWPSSSWHSPQMNGQLPTIKSEQVIITLWMTSYTKKVTCI